MSLTSLTRKKQPYEPILSLAEVPGLEPLAAICEDMDIDITAFGSLVRRLVPRKVNRSLRRAPYRDLFDLCPLMSDIDLVHTGRPDQTPAVKKAILRSVQFSECFRWQIYSKEELAVYDNDEPCLHFIPANKLRLGTRKKLGIQSRFNGWDEMINRRFSLRQNEFYERSALRQGKLDCELVHAIIYLELLAECGVPEGEYTKVSLHLQPGWKACKDMLQRSQNLETVIALQESSYLRTRIRYRLKGLRSKCMRSDMWKLLTKTSGLHRTIRWLDEKGAFGADKMQTELRPPGESVLISSCRLGGDLFRLEHQHPEWLTCDQAEFAWEGFRSREPLSMAMSDYPFPRLPGSVSILAASPLIPSRPGKAPSAGEGEHVALQVPLQWETAEAFLQKGENNLGVIGCFADPQGRPLFSVPFSSCSWLKQVDSEEQPEENSLTLLQIRLNSGRFLEVMPEQMAVCEKNEDDGVHIQLFIVAER